MIVLDASVLANLVGDDGMDGDLVRAEARAAEGLAIPDLAAVETVAVLRKRWLAGDLTAQRFARAVDDLQELDLDCYPALPLLRRAYELRANVTAYVATYVVLTEALDAELLTADRRLKNAYGPRCRIRLLEPNGTPP